jgi:hypothetical protein
MNLKIPKKMKLKIYSVALMTFIGMAAYSALIYAQVTTAQSPDPAASANPSHGEGGASSSAPPYAYSYAAPGIYSVSPDVYFSGSQDTTYLKKMRKLQEQQREIQKQMQELRTEENKKNNTDGVKERVMVKLKDMNVRLRDMNVKINRDINVKFDSAFNRNFTRSFSNNMKFNFNFDDNLDKKVQSGEVKEKTKTYTKSYPADGNDKLQIDNRYGKVTVTTWAKNEFKVDVQIKAYANGDAEAQTLLDQTSITDSKENNLVLFKTEIGENNKGNSWWGTMTNNGKTTIRKIVVSYTVYMPVKSAVSITNRYGLIELPALEGKVTINNSYGGLIAKSLINSDITVRYGAANIISLTGSDLNVSYGSLNLDAADKLNAVISYSPAKIGKLSTSGTFNIRYEGLEIGNLDKNLKSLSVNSTYAPIKVNVNPIMNADFNVMVHYTNFTYDNNSVNVTSKIPGDETNWSATRTFKGSIGKGNADKVITIKANYGAGVKFD